MKDIFALRLYTRVARLGSFSAAARECGLSQSQASRIIADLEADLGTRLLSRSTRAVVPTEVGAEFLSRTESILAALDEAEQRVRGDGNLRGLLRMSMPTSFGLHTLIPRLSGFTAKHPDLHIHLLLEDRRQDLVREAVDVAIRLGRLIDSSATTKLIATIPRVIVAAPQYLERAGVPAIPMDLMKRTRHSYWRRSIRSSTSATMQPPSGSGPTGISSTALTLHPVATACSTSSGRCPARSATRTS
jgi:DNA-binding transcriptional LysR family regulator